MFRPNPTAGYQPDIKAQVYFLYTGYQELSHLGFGYEGKSGKQRIFFKDKPT